MRLLMYALIIIFLSTLNISGQTIRYGLKGGISISNQEFDFKNNFIDFEFKKRLGPQIGIFAEFPVFSENFRVVPELFYSQKGMSDEQIVTDETGPESKGTIKFIHYVEYLSLPVSIKFAPIQSIIVPYLMVGPRIDFYLTKNFNTRVDATIPVPENFPDEYFSNYYGVDFNKIDWGGTFGIGIETRLYNKFNLLLEARYNPNFTASFEDERKKIKNDAFDIVIGVGF